MEFGATYWLKHLSSWLVDARVPWRQRGLFILLSEMNLWLRYTPEDAAITSRYSVALWHKHKVVTGNNHQHHSVALNNHRCQPYISTILPLILWHSFDKLKINLSLEFCSKMMKMQFLKYLKTLQAPVRQFHLHQKRWLQGPGQRTAQTHRKTMQFVKSFSLGDADLL